MWSALEASFGTNAPVAATTAYILQHGFHSTLDALCGEGRRGYVSWASLGPQ
jgi:hypothetical protein